MRLKKVIQLGSATVLSLGSLLTFGIPLAAAAGPYTCTWVGAGADSNFSTVANWSGCNSAAPVAGDNDNLVFDNANAGAQTTPTNDIVGLTVTNITFINTGLGGAHNIAASTPITVLGTISQDATVTGGDVDSMNNGFVLGADVTVKGVNIGTSTPSATPTVPLGGHTLTFNDGPNTSQIVAISLPISGSGTVTYNAPNTNYQLYEANTYSGTTNIVALSGSLLVVGVSSSQIFGTSAINVSSGAGITFNLLNTDNNTTINNTITLAGAPASQTDASTWQALFFSCTSGCANVKISVPNVVLNGSVRMGIAGTATVDLTGTKANGHCVEYYNDGGIYTGTMPSDFIGGPAACVVATTTAAAPKTGLAATMAQPIAVLAASVAAAFTLFAVARRVKTGKI
jgi:hypothetical protein